MTRKYDFVYISAERSNLSKEENERNTRLMEEELKTGGYDYMPIVAVYEGVPEASFYVRNISKKVAMKLTRKYHQEAFFTSEGMQMCDPPCRLYPIAKHGHRMGRPLELANKSIFPSGNAIALALEGQPLNWVKVEELD